MRRTQSTHSRDPVGQALLAKALALLDDPIFITDHDGHIVWVNEAFTVRSGYAPQEAIGRKPSLLGSGKQDASFYTALWETILAGRVWRGEVMERCKDGSLYVVEEVISPLRDADGTITHFAAIQHDVTLRKQATERERFLAYHDALTGLANRVLFLDLLQQAMARTAQHKRTLAVLFMDIDRFKQVNDSFGHDVGDSLLAAIALRLKAGVRKTVDAVARLSGDEFAILQSDLHDEQEAVALARKLIQSISQPFVLQGHAVRVSASIGIAIYHDPGETPQELLRRADKAMYLAKKNGLDNCQLYDRALCENLPTSPEAH
ncbi:MAG: sensor domain-containing diguanylate cyclase [Betaproteobacteria bacterium]|jgi:diguanylate cyclase (GGDEF)-like protein/PAS domain S-box-containing protein